MACGETHGLSARKTTHLMTPLRALPPPLLEAPPHAADHLHLPDRERSKKRCETRGPREREQRRCARERERRLAQEEVEAEETASNEEETEKTGDPFRPYVTPHSSHTSHRNPFLFVLLPKEGDRKKTGNAEKKACVRRRPNKRSTPPHTCRISIPASVR